MSAVYLGVDAGNSKTVALVCTASGEVVGAGRAGCGDISGARSESDAVAAVFAAIDAALEQSGVGRPRVGSAAFRLAGVDWPADLDFWERTLERRWPDLGAHSVANDGYAAIRCAEPSGVGVAVIAGTAAAIAARGAQGRTWHLGWWSQHSMGAQGLVGEATRAVCLAELGVAPPTALSGALLEFYGASGVTELREWFTRRHGRATQEQRLAAASTVTAVAVQGDAVARDIVAEQGRRLALYAEVAARKVGLTERAEPVPVVLSGSVLTAEASPVACELRGHLDARLPGASVHAVRLPPAAGAVLDAMAEAGLVIDEGTLERLASTAPAPGFLAT